jgi:quinol monooxygenase YgiN
MATADNCVSIHPYFRVPVEKIEQTRLGCQKFIEQTKEEPGCLYYSFTFADDMMHCREGYADADALLTHLKRVGPLIEQLLGTGVTIERLEVHGPAAELKKLHGPMAELSPTFFALADGFRR